LTTHYASFDYEFADLNGPVWWNDDPWSWHGAERTEDAFMNAPPTLGPVCRLLWRTFPDVSPNKVPKPNGGAWEPVQVLPVAMLQQLSDDLTISGEFIAFLKNARRLRDALEGLTRFGTAEEVPSIQRFETELPQRLQEVESILAKDPNSHFQRMEAQSLLAAAAKAKTEIAARNK
jgi:hypothetical protein